MSIKRRYRGRKRIKQSDRPERIKFNQNKLIIEVSRKNWAKSSSLVGWVRPMVADGRQFLRLAERQPLIFARQVIEFDIDQVEQYQIHIQLKSWLDWVDCKFWEVVPD